MKVALSPASGALPRVIVPSLNSTVPVGVALAGAIRAIAAVRVTVWPGALGLGEDISAVVVALLLTVCATEPLLPLKLPSPL